MIPEDIRVHITRKFLSLNGQRRREGCGEEEESGVDISGLRDAAT